jgi:chromosome partitioning protein
MGFLSRKPKPAPVVVEEQHPIVEELQRMEEAVPERPAINHEEQHPKAPEEHPPAGPVAAEAPADSGSAVQVEAPPAPVEEAEDGGPARMKASDLIAPSRFGFEPVQQAAEPEAPVKSADVIAFANQKGGVAKTTTTLNLAVAFAETGHRVLCVDLDPQGNLTMSQGIDPDKVERSLYDVLVNDMPISEIIQRREIDIAVASIDLAGAEIAMSTKIGRERSLEKALKEVIGDYDFICIDTPPSLGLLTINALTAADKVIVPVQCEYLSMRGLVQLQNTLRMIQENLNPDVRIEGILPTMLDTRTVHAKEAIEILEENFGDLVFRSRIRKAIKFAEAPVKGSSVLKYDSGSSAANYYRELAKEVLANGSA